MRTMSVTVGNDTYKHTFDGPETQFEQHIERFLARSLKPEEQSAIDTKYGTQAERQARITERTTTNIHTTAQNTRDALQAVADAGAGTTAAQLRTLLMATARLALHLYIRQVERD
jgi:hypothetical protein